MDNDDKAKASGLSGDEARAADAKAREAHLKSSQADREAEAARDNNVSVNNPKTPEAIEKHNERLDAALEKRNEENREGHEKNMKAIEERAAKPIPNAVVTGKQENRNTPRVLKDGRKVWDK